MKRNLRIILLFIVIVGFHLNSPAQGWTVTFQLAQSGPCGSVAPIDLLPAMVNFGFPNKGQCESLRQYVLSVSQSSPVYNGSKYIGDCKVFYTCAPCTGSDIVTASQLNPGELAFDGQFQGKPFFTTHESSAFEDWSKDYRQQLESLGIKLNPDNTVSASQFSLTGDKDFDAFYKKQTDNFNPKTPSWIAAKPDVKVDVVSSKEVTGVVDLLTTPEQLAKRDKWYDEKGFDNLTLINQNEGISENQPAGRSITDAAARTALGEAPGIYGVIADFGINVLDGSLNTVTQGINSMKSGDNAKTQQLGNEILNGSTAYNAIGKTTGNFITNGITDLVTAPILGLVKGASAIYTVIKIRNSYQENKNPND
jgi:hypothetical protein